MKKRKITIADQRRAAKKAKLVDDLAEAVATAPQPLLEWQKDRVEVYEAALSTDRGSESGTESTPAEPPLPPPAAPPPAEPFDGLGAAIARALRSRRA